VAAMAAAAKKNLEQVAAKAAQWRMYVMIAGVVDRLERNEAILYDRAGKEVWRYFKIVQTHPEQICGDQVPVYDTDFGRLGAWICADEAHVEIPRCLLVQGADLVFTPTQSWGPDATYRDDRDISRAMNAGLFLVEVTHPSTEPLHNSKIIDPCGAVVAQSGYNTAGYTTAVLDLDHQRPRRYAREWTAHTPGGYLPEYQEERIGKECNDLFDVTRAQRRPELYRGILWPEK
ncbi:MAG: carbon-nitrogen hydrolase family protein, partial [Armatimonadetes bacterium]|nr:carbon-nitrogen hydrolase family protein [Armatimonadota bacterium]